MGKEAELENCQETAPNLELLDMGDAVEEIKSTAPIPRFVDSAMGGWGVHPGW
jgi:hypothetical protein